MSSEWYKNVNGLHLNAWYVLCSFCQSSAMYTFVDDSRFKVKALNVNKIAKGGI